jgi:hypothetical protein
MFWWVFLVLTKILIECESIEDELLLSGKQNLLLTEILQKKLINLQKSNTSLPLKSTLLYFFSLLSSSHSLSNLSSFFPSLLCH